MWCIRPSGTMHLLKDHLFIAIISAERLHEPHPLATVLGQ